MIGRIAATLAAAAGVLIACSLRSEPPAQDAGAPTAKARDGGDARSSRRPLRLFLTGSDDGYLDACGCDDGLLGGLPRRAELLKTLGARDDGALVLSNGGLVTGAGELDLLKVRVLVQAMASMQYVAVAITERELALGREVLSELAALLGDGVLLATNLVEKPQDGAEPLPAARAVERSFGGETTVVMSAVAPTRAALYRNADPRVDVADPIAALREALARNAGARRRVVLAQMELEEATALAKALPEIDLIILPSADEEDSPRDAAVEVGRTWIVDTGRKGKFLGEFRFGTGEELPDYRRHPVVDRIVKDEGIENLLHQNYREALFDLKVIESYYQVRATASGASYVGAEEGSCASCHPKAWATWAASKHAHAWQTLVDQDLPPSPDDPKSRQPRAVWDPDCVRCHVTGFGEKSGYAGLEHERPEARLIDVGCEACHGPAGDHAQRASEGDPRWPNAHLPKVPSLEAHELCARCHDPDNSPHFVLGEYWKGIVRGEQRATIEHGREGD